MPVVHKISSKPLILKNLGHILHDHAKISLSEEARAKIIRCRNYLDQKLYSSTQPIYGINTGSSASRLLVETMSDCVAMQNAPPNIDTSSSIQDDLIDILKRIGGEHRPWLVNLWKSHQIHQEPIMNDSGQIVADPLFWFERDGLKWACFENGNSGNVANADSLAAYRIQILHPGITIDL